MLRDSVRRRTGRKTGLRRGQHPVGWLSRGFLGFGCRQLFANDLVVHGLAALEKISWLVSLRFEGGKIGSEFPRKARVMID